MSLTLRRLPWRSPADQPPWARPALLAVAAAAAVLYAWNIRHSQLQGYYSMAVRSMTGSWQAFLFGSVDPAGSITIDKIPGFLWPQAVSARIFGFHPWALALPQVIEGVVSVLVLYRVARRWAGPVAGLIAAAGFALTPITAVMFGHTTMADPALTMCLILAADAWQQAAGTARLPSLLLSGVWVGLGFQAKMLQAWAVLPAFAAAYLVVAPVGLRTRIRQLVAAGGVTVAVSALWIAIVTLVPADHRPYIDGTTNNSAYAMVVGYNGLSRFGGIHVPGALSVTGSAGGPTAGGPQLAQLLPYGDRTGWGKLFDPYLASQIGWLYPVAILALVVGLVQRRHMPRTDAERGGYLMWGGWLVATGLAFSAGQVAHATYMAALAAPLAALTGAGLTTLWRAYRAGGPSSWLLPAAVAADVAWAAYLARRYPSFLPWLLPVTVALAALGVAGLVAARLTAGRTTARTGARLAVAGLVAGLAAMMANPAAWALSTVDQKYAGTVIEAAAGPAGRVDVGPLPAGFPPGRLPPGAGSLATSLTADQKQLMDFVTAHRDGAKYLFATDSWSTASPYILATGQPVLPMGGFSGAVPSPTREQFQRLLSTGQLRYVLLSTGGFSIPGMLGRAPGATEAGAIADWVRRHCTPAPVGANHGPGRPPGAGTGQWPPVRGAGVLYACDPDS